MKHSIRVVLGMACIGALLSACSSLNSTTEKVGKLTAKPIATVDRTEIRKIYVQGPDQEGMFYIPSDTYAPYRWAKRYENTPGLTRPAEYRSVAVDDKIVGTVAAAESILQSRSIEVTHNPKEASHILVLTVDTPSQLGHPVGYSTQIIVRKRIENGFMADVSTSVTGELMKSDSKQSVANAWDSYSERRAIKSTDIPGDWYAFNKNDQGEVIKAANWVRCRSIDLMLQKMGL